MNHCEDSSLLSGQADAEDYLRTRENEDRKLVLSAIYDPASCTHGYLRSGEGIAAARLHLGDDGSGRSDSLQ
jgi:hypothetical protein